MYERNEVCDCIIDIMRQIVVSRTTVCITLNDNITDILMFSLEVDVLPHLFTSRVPFIAVNWDKAFNINIFMCFQLFIMP